VLRDHPRPSRKPKLVRRRQSQQRSQAPLRHRAAVGAHPVQDPRLKLEQRQDLRHPRTTHPVLPGKVSPVDTTAVQPRLPAVREREGVEDRRPPNSGRLLPIRPLPAIFDIETKGQPPVLACAPLREFENAS
jgi:hypothetical protein